MLTISVSHILNYRKKHFHKFPILLLQTMADENMGKHKVPALRNVDKRAEIQRAQIEHALR